VRIPEIGNRRKQVENLHPLVNKGLDECGFPGRELLPAPSVYDRHASDALADERDSGIEGGVASSDHDCRS
jgi:hypothetical protein